MTLKAEKIQIKALEPAVNSADGKGLMNESVLRLARLIGKQIARENFEKDASKETRRRFHTTGKKDREPT